MLRFTDCNSVLVLDQKGSKARENGSAALSFSLIKAARRAYILLQLFSINLRFCD
jgi:hypothetical protein